MKRKDLNTHRSPTSLIMRLPPPTSRPPSPARRAGASRAGAQLSNGGWVWGTHPGGRPGNGHRDDTHQPPVARCSQEWQMPGGAECPGGRGSCSEGSPPHPVGSCDQPPPPAERAPEKYMEEMDGAWLTQPWAPPPSPLRPEASRGTALLGQRRGLHGARTGALSPAPASWP